MLPEDFGDVDEGKVLQLLGAALGVPALVLEVQLLRQRFLQVLMGAGQRSRVSNLYAKPGIEGSSSDIGIL